MESALCARCETILGYLAPEDVQTLRSLCAHGERPMLLYGMGTLQVGKVRCVCQPGAQIFGTSRFTLASFPGVGSRDLPPASKRDRCGAHLAEPHCRDALKCQIQSECP